MNETVYVVSIHDRSSGGSLAFDLRDVLAALGDKMSQWSWRVDELDALGDEEVQSFCDTVESHRENSVLMTTEELISLAGKIEQTIDGKFFAFPNDIRCAELTSKDLDWGHAVVIYNTNIVRSVPDSELIATGEFDLEERL